MDLWQFLTQRVFSSSHIPAIRSLLQLYPSIASPSDAVNNTACDTLEDVARETQQVETELKTLRDQLAATQMRVGDVVDEDHVAKEAKHLTFGHVCALMENVRTAMNAVGGEEKDKFQIEQGLTDVEEMEENKWDDTLEDLVQDCDLGAVCEEMVGRVEIDLEKIREWEEWEGDEGGQEEKARDAVLRLWRETQRVRAERREAEERVRKEIEGDGWKEKVEGEKGVMEWMERASVAATGWGRRAEARRKRQEVGEIVEIAGEGWREAREMLERAIERWDEVKEMGDGVEERVKEGISGVERLQREETAEKKETKEMREDSKWEKEVKRVWREEMERKTEAEEEMRLEMEERCEMVVEVGHQADSDERERGEEVVRFMREGKHVSREGEIVKEQLDIWVQCPAVRVLDQLHPDRW